MDPIGGDNSILVLNSFPQIYTGRNIVKLLSGESLLEAKYEGIRRKEGVCQKDIGVKGIPFKNICSLTPISLL